MSVAGNGDARGPASSSPPQRVPCGATEKGVTEVKLIFALAAVLTSAMFTVPTVTDVGAANAADIRLALAAVQAEALHAVA